MNDQHPEQRPVSNFTIDEYTKEKMNGAGKTARILAFMSIASAVLAVVGYFIIPAKKIGPAKEGFDEATLNALQTSNSFSVFVSVVMSIIIFYLLNRFAASTRIGLTNNNTKKLEDGLSSLAMYFKIAGVIMILAVVFIFLMLIATMFTAAN